jgi:DUF1680 family protein
VFTVNGKIAGDVVAGTYFTIARTWSAGDVVEVYFPMTYWSSPVVDDRPAFNSTMAFMHGDLPSLAANPP